MAENNYFENQTQFANQEPIFEDEVYYPDEEQPVVEQKPNPMKKYILIGVSVFVVLILIVLVLAVMSQPKQKVEESLPSPTPQMTVESQDKFEKRLEEVRQDLEISDPAKKDIIFPPVNMEISF